MELFNALGVNWKILTAQLVNFAIFFFVLMKFGYKPIMDFLRERRNKIEKGIDDARQAKRQLEEASVREQEIIRAAKAEAVKLVYEAREEAAARKEEILAKAKDEIGRMMEQERERLRLDKQAALREVRRDVSELVLTALRQVLPEAAGEAKDRELVRKAVEKLKRK